MKVAVIGANGFIGSRIVESFVLVDDMSVVAISHRVGQHTLAARFDVELRTAELSDPAALGQALEGCSVAIHVARGASTEIKGFSAALSEAIVTAGVRKVVYLSSAAIHGPSPLPGTTEETRLNAKSSGPLAQTHAAAEKQFFTRCRAAGISGYALRPGIVYGPRSRLVDELATELRDRSAWVVSNDAVFNGIYVDNLILAIRLCLRAKPAAGRAFLVADAETVTWRDLYLAMAHQLEFSATQIRQVDPGAEPAAASPGMTLPPSLAERARNQQSTVKLGFAAATQALRYQPAITFAEGLRRTCGWWRFAQGDFASS